MNKEQTFEILTNIKSAWDRFEITQQKIDFWHLTLKNYDYQIILDNLTEYAQQNKFPPTIADLTNADYAQEHQRTAVKSVEETRKMFEEYDKLKENRSSDEYREKALKEIGEKLKGMWNNGNDSKPL